jgi:hypothetical protein
MSSSEAAVPESEFVVERILNDRMNRDGTQLYLVKWERFSDSEATWEPAEHLSASQEILDEYVARKLISHFSESEMLPDPESPESSDSEGYQPGHRKKSTLDLKKRHADQKQAQTDSPRKRTVKNEIQKKLTTIEMPKRCRVKLDQQSAKSEPPTQTESPPPAKPAPKITKVVGVRILGGLTLLSVLWDDGHNTEVEKAIVRDENPLLWTRFLEGVISGGQLL